MVLGGGDGSKPSVSFLKFEPKVSNFPQLVQSLVPTNTTAKSILYGARLARPNADNPFLSVFK